MTQIYDDIPASPLSGDGRVLGIGVFDGVHRGHQAVVRKVKELAEERQAKSLLLTFDRLPEELLRPETAPKRLMGLQEKLDVLAALGPEEIMVAHVKPELLGQEPSQFAVETIHEKLHPRVVVVGEDFRYGRGGKGNIETLTADAAQNGFEVVVVPPVHWNGEKVSSTRIRTLISEGSVDGAADLLTRPYRLSGRVVTGRQQGRLLGFPTANVEAPSSHLIPGHGVYACRAFGDDFARDAAVNIGVRPTLAEGQGVTVEAYLLEFEGDLYRQELRLEFIARLRGEQRFPSLDALKEQLARDVEETRRLLSPA
ncbi:MAG: bifunctional riboflavin kinase/FAD synthetase [Armatimonadetes bacterium]|nr:bifunctional riboflavin kinase/FAD synthetase [Armatimonadota bacterium]